MDDAILSALKDLPNVLKDLKTTLANLTKRIPIPVNKKGSGNQGDDTIKLDLEKSDDEALTKDEFNNSLKSAGDLIGIAAVAKMAGFDLKDLTTPAGIKGLAKGAGSQVFEQIKANSKVVDEAKKKQEELQQATNFTSDSYDKFAKSLEGSTPALNSLALNMNDAKEAQVKLTEGSGAYRKMMQMDTHKKFGNQLASLAAQWKAMGIPVTTTAQTFEYAANQLGMLDKNADLSKKNIKGFFNTLLKQAQLSNQPYKKIQESTTGAMSKMSLLGKTMVYNMGELQNALTNTGIAQDKFLTMAGKYETVEGAASQVGQLNAVLKGTTLGIGEMMAAEPVDRVKKVIGDVNLAMKEGRFKLAEGGAMRVAQIKALAQAAGIEEQAMDALLRKKMKVEEIFKASGKIKHPTTEAAAKAAQKSLSTEAITKIPQKTMENEILTQGTVVSDYTKVISKSSAQIADGMKKFGKSIAGFTAKLNGLHTALNRILPEGADKDKGGLYTQLLFGNIEHFRDFSKVIQEAATAGMKGSGAADKIKKQNETIEKRVKEAVEKALKKKGGAAAAPASGASSSKTATLKSDGQGGLRGPISLDVEVSADELNKALNNMQAP